MTVYEYLLAVCKESSHREKADFMRVHIDLDTRNISCGGVELVRQGALVTDHAKLPSGEAVSLTSLIAFSGDPYAEIERLYAWFKRSVPGKREKLNRGRFKALSADQLTMAELENNPSRMEARVRLEGFICLAASAGVIRWRVPGHFFWQGQDPDCILYRSWIMNKSKEESHEIRKAS